MQVQRIQMSNPTSNVVVLTPDADRPKAYLRFEGHGDVEGGDVQFMSRNDVLQTPVIKAVKRGVLKVDTDVSGDEELSDVLRVTAPAAAAERKPLTATRVDYKYDEATDTYNRVETAIPVVVEPLTKG
ncbi:hypothetical protein [Streptomyces sp. NPDC088752]|uniref:hypothetical protein n=1 Tax=Streptomyces sp. NPDC088752 TaxID=3154963 RepID=UPI0034447CDE